MWLGYVKLNINLKWKIECKWIFTKSKSNQNVQKERIIRNGHEKNKQILSTQLSEIKISSAWICNSDFPRQNHIILY